MTSFRQRFWTASSALLLLVAPSCLDSSTGTETGPGSGKAGVYLEDMTWGRLVDVLDADGELVYSDVIIRESLQSDGINYRLSQNLLTQSDVLTILHDQSSSAFETALSDARSGLASLQSKGFDDPPPFTKVARNGAIRLVFSEYLDPATVDRQTIQVLVQESEVSFQNLEVRYVVKQGVGQDGVTPKGIVLIDPTISRIDAARLNIPENGVGLPQSFDQVNANIKIRIPTTVNPFLNQTMVLTNSSGTRTFDVRRSSNGLTIEEPFEVAGFDPVSVRAFRSGNQNDLFKGFMTDNTKPSLVVTQDVTIASVQAVGTVRTLTYAMDAVRCRGLTPKPGDVFEVGDAIVQVTQVVNASNPAALRVQGTLLIGELPAGAGSRPGQITTRYTVADTDLQLCFVTFGPEPVELPGVELDPYASATVSFSEPIDSRTVRSMDSMVLASVDVDAPTPGPGEDPDPARPWNSLGSGETVADYIDRLPGFGLGGGSGRILFGPITVAGDSRAFTLTPIAGMTDAHGEGSGFPQGMFLNLALRDGPDGIFDLAGNQVDFAGFVAGAPTQDEFMTLAGASTSWPLDKYFALRGNGSDENGDQLAEYGGQLGPSQGDGILRGRPLTRFTRAADSSNQYVGQRLRFGAGIMTPLTPAGAVLQTIWGYHHLGFGLTNPTEYNLGVEGLSWSPFDGLVYDDVFNRYSVALAHSNRYPDDYIDPTSGYPRYANSGLRRLSSENFDRNIFLYGDDPVTYQEYDEKVMFDSVYQISDINKYINAAGNFMYPWPDFEDTYVWRDTSMPIPTGTTTTGGAPVGQAWGAPPYVVSQSSPTYQTSKIPSIGLPLLMRYRCYTRGAEFGFNGFQVQIMVGSSSLPAFRVFSAGGRDGQGTWHLVRPDLPPAGTSPVGGYNTVTGLVTKSYGPELYWGEVDFVTNVSRVFTHWFEFGGEVDTLSSITLEPTPQQADPGTEVLVEFRSTETISLALCQPEDRHALNDATQDFSAYGDYDQQSGCATLSTATDWTFNPSDLLQENHSFFQMRFTFVSNSQQDLQAELDAFGFAWTVQP